VLKPVSISADDRKGLISAGEYIPKLIMSEHDATGVADANSATMADTVPALSR